MTNGIRANLVVSYNSRALQHEVGLDEDVKTQPLHTCRKDKFLNNKGMYHAQRLKQKHINQQIQIQNSLKYANKENP